MSIRHRLGALQEPRFRLLWTAQSFSSIGDSMVLVAVPFAALQIGGSPTAVGLVFAAGLVPRIALMLVGGVWADRLPRQHVMIAADLVRAHGPGGRRVRSPGGRRRALAARTDRRDPRVRRRFLHARGERLHPRDSQRPAAPAGKRAHRYLSQRLCHRRACSRRPPRVCVWARVGLCHRRRDLCGQCVLPRPSPCRPGRPRGAQEVHGRSRRRVARGHGTELGLGEHPLLRRSGTSRLRRSSCWGLSSATASSAVPATGG